MGVYVKNYGLARYSSCICHFGFIHYVGNYLRRLCMADFDSPRTTTRTTTETAVAKENHNNFGQSLSAVVWNCFFR